MQKRFEDILQALTDPKRLKLRLFIEGNVIGVLTGLTIALFRYLLEISEANLPRLYQFLQENPVYIPGWFFVLMAIGCILHWLLRMDGMISGSGIPQIKGVLMGKMDMHWARVLLLKFTGAVLGIGVGLSLGREGPSVQLGACLGQGVGRLTHRSYEENHYLLTAGAGAGLAAAFNAPLAGAIFCLEELTKNFSPYVLMGSIAATVTATTVTQFFFGMEPVFHMGEIPVVMAGNVYVMLILLGVFVGVLGLGFNRMLTISLDSYAKSPLKAWQNPLLPLLAAGVIGFFLPQILGGGSPLVDALVEHEYAIGFLLLLLTGKFFFTMLCFGSGVPGGIFLPMLVLGALGGAIFAKLAIAAQLMDAQWAVTCIVFGMAAYFSAVVKSPVTGAILIMEMTGSYQHLLSLMLVSMTAFLVAEWAGSEPVYDMLLNRSLRLMDRARSYIKESRHNLS